MSTISSSLAVAGAIAAAIMPVPASAEPIAAERFGLYVVSDDLDRATAFYERLFGRAQMRTAGMVGFNVAGGLYAVVSRQAFAPMAKRGDTTRPYVKVRNINVTFDRVKESAPASIESEAVQAEGMFSYFRFRDPDGNVVEFFSVTAPR